MCQPQPQALSTYYLMALTTILHDRYSYPLSAHEMILTPQVPHSQSWLPPSLPPHSCPTLLIHSYKSSHVDQLRAIISGLERNQVSSKEEVVQQGTFFPLLEYSGLWAVQGVGERTVGGRV